MKPILFAIFFALLTSFSLAQKKEENKSGSLESKQTTEKCSENSDALYNRQKVLEQLADILNKSIPSYAKIFRHRFAEENGRGNFFFVYDLTDPSNVSDSTAKCIDFKNNHIYHFSPYWLNFSYSHILILEDGKLKVFKSIDCWGKGDKLEDVISYASKKLENNKDKDEIIERVKNYRKYGRYFEEDKAPMSCKGYEINDK
jgi:hypothetical protein